MTTAAKKIKKEHVKLLLKRKTTKAKKNPSSFFGKLKDGVDGLSYQKSSVMSGTNYLVDTKGHVKV